MEPATTMPAPAPAPTTITHTPTNHPIYANFQGRNFLTDPVFEYFLNQTPWYHRAAATYHTVRLQLHAASHNNRALYYSASSPSTTSSPSIQPALSPASVELDPQCNAVIMCPGQGGVFDVGLSGWIQLVGRGIHKMFWYASMKPWKGYWEQYVVPVERAKAATFSAKEDYYYISLISTDLRHRGKGLAQALIKDVQLRAQDEGKPIWLEASTPSARRVYLKCGFLDVGVDGEESVGEGFRMGAGEVDGQGERCEGNGAVGVPVWPMVWWPEGYKKTQGTD